MANDPIRGSAASRTDRRGTGLASRLALPGAGVLGALVIAVLLTFQTSRAAFNSTTENGSNTFGAGTVTLSDDDSGSTMFILSGMKPGDSATKCINVTYGGSLPADVKLYGTVAGTGLAAFLDTVVEVGTGAAGGSSTSCTGFSSSSTLHSGTLAAFGAANTNYGNGLGGFSGATNPTTRSYRIAVTLQDANAAQGLDATATFTWEAQNT